jgi:ABC-type transport system involved in multi-copper enzyme maturation permease subunit
MTLEDGIPNFWIWLLGDPVKQRLFLPETWGFLWGAMAIVLLAMFVIPLIAFILTAGKYGPSEAFYFVTRSVVTAVTVDLPGFSLRRTLAIARLAIQEAIRNRVLIGFVVFVVLLLFAGLFLDVKNDNPARVYLSFVLGTTNYLVLLMALVLSAFSIPTDIKNRTIYTVVTKPIRASEIVLGRSLGFLAVGTLMLLAMGLISYLFVVRGLRHEHQAVVAELTEEVDPSTGNTIRRGTTSFDAYHRHTFEIDEEGKGKTNLVHGHYHDVQLVGSGPEAQIVVGPPKGDLIARAPIFGQLQILNSAGEPVEKGINVGNEWEYRGYIEGGPPGGASKAAAIWTFDGVTEDRFPDGLPLELNLRVFRTFKGDIEQGVLGEIVIRNPNPSAPVRQSGPILFTSKEYVSDQRFIPRELNPETGSGAGGKIDLFEDLVSDGKVQVEIRCVDSGQYFGVALPDVYLRPADSSFELNFAKAYLSIWLQMVLVTGFGVMFSTFLSGPVAMMATISAAALGFFGEFVRGIARGAVEGGGPIESTIRIITQQNVMTELEVNSLLSRIVHFADLGLMNVLQAATFVLPDYTQFDTARFVADGYNIFPDLVAQQVAMTAIYFLAVTIVGYFCLKSREIAA